MRIAAFVEVGEDLMNAQTVAVGAGAGLLEGGGCVDDTSADKIQLRKEEFSSAAIDHCFSPFSIRFRTLV